MSFNTQQGATQRINIASFVHQCFDPGHHIRAFLHFIKKNQCLASHQRDSRICRNSEQQFFDISCPIDYVHRLRLKQEIELNEIQAMPFSIFPDRIGLTYLSGTGKKQRFLRV